MEMVLLAGRMVPRVGISTTGLRTAGMWGEPAGRRMLVAAVRRAVELGAVVLEVTVPFGPGADLLREAGVGDAFVAARLTERLPDLAAVRHRLGGRRPDLVLVDEHLLDEVSGWDVPLGAVVGARTHGVAFAPLAAVRGPYPANRRMVEWCESRPIPYLAPSTEILGAGKMTVALPAPSNVKDVERILGGAAPPTPPAGPPTPRGGEPG